MCQETARIARVQDPKVHASHRNRRQGLVWCEKPIPIAIGGKRLIRRPYRFRTTRYDSAEGAYLTKVRRPTCSAPASCSPILQALQALLLGGQQYYLCVVSYYTKPWQALTPKIRITVGISIADAALVGLPFVPDLYRPVLGIPRIALMCSMACRVHRNLVSEGRQDASKESRKESKILIVLTNIADNQTRLTRSATGHRDGI